MEWFHNGATVHSSQPVLHNVTSEARPGQWSIAWCHAEWVAWQSGRWLSTIHLLNLKSLCICLYPIGVWFGKIFKVLLNYSLILITYFHAPNAPIYVVRFYSDVSHDKNSFNKLFYSKWIYHSHHLFKPFGGSLSMQDKTRYHNNSRVK